MKPSTGMISRLAAVLVAFVFLSSCSRGGGKSGFETIHLLEQPDHGGEAFVPDSGGAVRIGLEEVLAGTRKRSDAGKQTSTLRGKVLSASSLAAGGKIELFCKRDLDGARYLAFVMSATGSHEGRVAFYDRDFETRLGEKSFALIPDGEPHCHTVELAGVPIDPAEVGGFAVSTGTGGVTVSMHSLELRSEPPIYYARLDRSNDRRGAVLIPQGRNFEIPLPEGSARLSFAVSPSTIARLYPSAFADIEFSVRVIGSGRDEVVHSELLRPGGGRSWRNRTIDLSGYRWGKKVRFEVESPGEGASPVYVALGAPGVEAQDETPKPSLILFVIDTLRGDHLGCMGYAKNVSPGIDRFARHAVVFESAYAQDSWTKASIATILSSLYPQVHGAVGWDDRLPSEVLTLPEVLRSEGYYTAAFVTATSVGSIGLNFEQGFDQFVAMTEDHHDSLTSAAEVMARLLPWLRENKERRFFLYVHLMDPHAPYFPVPPFDTMFDPDYEGDLTGATSGRNSFRKYSSKRDIQHAVSLYDGEIAYADEHFTVFVDELKKYGLLESSGIVLTADHGEEFKEHGAWEHGHTLYQELIRIPLLVKFPGMSHGGKRVRQRVRHLDIAPTMLDLAGLDIPDEMQGGSLVPLVAGKVDRVCEEVFSEQNLNRDALYSLISGSYKYVLRTSPRFGQELYDLKNDPSEKENLLRRNATVAGRMAGELMDIVSGSPRLSRLRFASRGKAVWSGKIRSKGIFARVSPVAFSPEDKIALGYSGQVMSFTVSTSGGSKGFDFVIAPPEAAIVFDLTLDGKKLDGGGLLLGPEQVKASVVPFNTERLSSPVMLFAPEGESPVKVTTEPRCYFWKTVSGGVPASSKTSLDRKTRDKLKALGYVE